MQNSHKMRIIPLSETREFVMLNGKSIQKQRESPVLFEKINQCPYVVYLLGTGSLDLIKIEEESIDQAMIYNLHHTWLEIQNNNIDIRNFHQLIKADDLMMSHSDQWYTQGYFIFRLKSDNFIPKFLIVTRQEIITSFPWQSLQLLSNLWQVENGYIVLHTCGIMRNDHIYLFSGPSGAGKSTIAELSMSRGYIVLDEDQILIKYHKLNDSYKAKAWGYSLQDCEAPIKAFIRIKQAKSEHLLKLSQTKTAQWMLEQSFYLTPGLMSQETTEKLFARIAEFGRAIPGYELEFRKSVEFWKLFDKVNL